MKRLATAAVLLLCALPASAATLYVSPAGSGTAPYDTWAKAATTVQAALTAANGGSDIVEISGGAGGQTYSETVTTAANVTIKGSAQAGHNGWVKISGALGATQTLTANHNTTLQDLEITGATGANYNILIGVGKAVTGTRIKITDGGRGIYNNGTVTLTRSTISGIGSWPVNNVNATKVATLNYCLLENSGPYTVAWGTHNIYNSLLIGFPAGILDVALNNAQVLNLKNSILMVGGLTNRTIHVLTNTSTNAVVTATNNVVLANSQNPGSFGINGFTTTDSLYVSPRFRAGRRPAKLIVQFNSETTGDFSFWQTITDYANAKGIRTSLYLDAPRNITDPQWATLRTYQTAGNSIGLQAQNHVTLTNLSGLSIDGPVGSTIDIAVDTTAASSASWTGTLTMNEAGTPGKYVLDISRGGSFGTLALLAAEIATKAGWTASVVETGDGVGLGNKRREIFSVALASVAAASTAAAYSSVLNRDRFYFTELVETKALMESKGIVCNLHSTPAGSTDATLRAWLAIDSHGYFAKGGTTPFLASTRSYVGSYTLSDDRQSDDPLAYGLSVFGMAMQVISTYVGAATIQRDVHTLVEWLRYIGGCTILLGHNATDFSEANWKLAIDALAETGLPIDSAESTIAWVRQGTDADGNGTRWTRTFTNAADYRLKCGSPLLDRGVDVSLTSDFAGTRVPMGFRPDIGAYENMLRNTNYYPPRPPASVTTNYYPARPETCPY